MMTVLCLLSKMVLRTFTDLHGAGRRCYVNSGYPVTAIVRIKQSKENRVEVLSKSGAFCALYPSFPPAFLRDTLFEDYICEFISLVLTTVPVYILHCLPDKEAANLVLDTVYKSKIKTI